MFGWFAPMVPLDPAAKKWVESRLLWLAREFGPDVFLRRAMILPTVDFFPDPIEGTEASLRNLLDQVCGYMDVDPDAVELRLMTNRSNLGLVNGLGQMLPGGPAGLYEETGSRTRIHLDTAELLDQTGLIGTLAHELSHQKLMGENRVSGHNFDNELLTDLNVVFHGMGIFLGNKPRHWDSQYGVWPGTKLRRPEYMTLPMFGYALAHAAWLRGEPKPEWMRHLSLELRACFKQSLAYLMKTGDSTISPDKFS